jgi:heterodisulfide reductase subunit B
MELAYFPGCSLHGLAREYGSSVKAVCKRLGIVLKEVPDWNCCGASAAHSRDRYAAVYLSARNLAIAANSGYGRIVTACAGCFNRLKTASHKMKEDEKIREGLAESTGLSLRDSRDSIEVVHLLQVFSEEEIASRIKTEMKKSLGGIRLAAYYGCMLSRPAAVMKFDDPEQPRIMDDLLRSLGAETVDWPHKSECCGGSLAAAEPEIIIELSGDILESARQAGADAIVVACPMCQANLDLRQKEIEKRRGAVRGLPVFYFTQLMGLALGCPERQLGFRLLMTDPKKVLRKIQNG